MFDEVVKTACTSLDHSDSSSVTLVHGAEKVNYCHKRSQTLQSCISAILVSDNKYSAEIPMAVSLMCEVQQRCCMEN